MKSMKLGKRKSGSYGSVGWRRAKGDEAMGGRESAPEFRKALQNNNLKAQSHRSVTTMWIHMETHNSANSRWFSWENRGTEE